jgi:hypothetical protein
MPLIRKHKLLFIHIPKTGGSSIEKFFGLSEDDPYGDMKEGLHNGVFVSKFPIPLDHSVQHCSYLEYKRIIPRKLGIGDSAERWEIFTVVRNPISRLFSELVFQKYIPSNTVDLPLSKARHTIEKVIVDLLTRSFETLLVRYPNIRSGHPGECYIHLKPQYEFLCDENGKLVPDITILHTENLEQEFERLGYGTLGERTNKSILWPRPYRDYLTPKAARTIWKAYKIDFRLFGYANPCKKGT